MKKIYLFLILFISFVFVCGPASNVFADGVEINTASLEQLDQIVGIGPAIGQRIIDARPFSSLDDLLKVKGIGDKTLQKIKDQGLAYVQNGTGQTSSPAEQTQSPPKTPVTQTPTQQIASTTYPDGIIINEILPSPEGPDETDEWIKLYNKNSADVNLEGWKIEDTEGTITTYIFPKDTVIGGGEYMTLKRPTTKIILNNQGDGLHLLQPNGKIIASVSYTTAPKNESYINTDDDWQWSRSATPIKTTAPTTKNAPILPITQKTDNKYLSAISESINLDTNQAPENSDPKSSLNPWLLFLGALAVIIILGISILIFKKYVRS